MFKNSLRVLSLFVVCTAAYWEWEGPFFSSIGWKTFITVAQALFLAIVGIIVTKLGHMDDASRKILSGLCLTVTIPCRLFTNTINCPQMSQSGYTGTCDSLLDTLKRAWLLLFLPFAWVSVGVALGYLTVVLARTPLALRRTAIAAVGFGNATAIPIVLLTTMSQVSSSAIYSWKLAAH